MKQSKFKKRAKKIIKWTAIIVLTYWLGTTLYFGYSDIDERKGMYVYYWSGLNALWQDDKEFGFKHNEIFETKLDGADGPYIFGDTIYRVDSENSLYVEPLDSSRIATVEADNADKDVFQVTLRKDYIQEADQFPLPEKMIAISDIEGNFDGFYSFLIANGVMDKQYHWTYGTGHLVLDGDFVDRGKNTTQVLWLIYKLEQEAEKVGGKVHYILGNHEIMNLYGDVSYCDFKYMEVAKRIANTTHWDKGLRRLFSAESELGKWLRSKNIAERIGPYLFVHAGLNTKHVDEKLSFKEMNTIARKYYGIYPDQKLEDKRHTWVLSSYFSPYWDRSLSMNFLYRAVYFFNDPSNAPTHKPSQEELEKVLRYYGGEKLVIGHSVVDAITADYKGKVLKIDVKHGHEKESGKTVGLLIENGKEYAVDDKGRRLKL